MDLYPWERDYYVQYIKPDPEVTGTWQASFDQGATWHDGLATTAEVEIDGVMETVDAWAWLVAGPTFASMNDGLDLNETKATITEDQKPWLRLKESPIMDAKVGTSIKLKTQE